jgi:hypothetical protein
LSILSISFKKLAGSPIPVGTVNLIPVSEAVIIRTPGWVKGLIWNRPIAVGVQEPGEEEKLLPIYDYTRLAQVLILGIGLFGSVLIWMSLRKR